MAFLNVFNYQLGIVVIVLLSMVCFTRSETSMGLPEATLLVFDKIDKHFVAVNGTNVTITEGETILFRCQSNYPVQYIYSGMGGPSLALNTSWIIDESHSVSYVATLLAENIKEENTGQYKCRSSEYPHKFTTSYQLFVPGENVFTISKGRDVEFSVHDSHVRIPCPVSNKTAVVLLKKYSDDMIQDAFNSSVADYDPTVGFNFNLKSVENPEGVYICTANSDNKFRVIEFLLKAIDKGLKNESSTVHLTNTCKSFYCAPHQECKMGMQGPHCFCKRGYVKHDCDIWCLHDNDCLKHQKCENDTKRSFNTCVNKCEGHMCGKNAECQNDLKGNSVCVCRPGYAGNPLTLCSPIAIVSTVQTATSYCHPSRCGPFAKCELKAGKTNCVCIRGAVGRAPNCTLGCGTDDDCPLDKSCSAFGECLGICDETKCGKMAVCRVLRRQPICSWVMVMKNEEGGEESAVGQLEEGARKRKDRLRALRQKLRGVEDNAEERKVEITLPKPIFRSYNPQDENFQDSSKPKAKPIDIESQVSDTLEQGQVKTLLDDVELTNLAPRKPDWDLKRDVAPKLLKLERRTQRAIAELIMERLKDSQDLAAAVQIGPNVRTEQEDDD